MAIGINLDPDYPAMDIYSYNRAMNYYDTLLSLLDIDEKDLPKGDYVVKDAYILEKLKDSLGEAEKFS